VSDEQISCFVQSIPLTTGRLARRFPDPPEGTSLLTLGTLAENNPKTTGEGSMVTPLLRPWSVVAAVKGNACARKEAGGRSIAAPCSSTQINLLYFYSAFAAVQCALNPTLQGTEFAPDPLSVCCDRQALRASRYSKLLATSMVSNTHHSPLRAPFTLLPWTRFQLRVVLKKHPSHSKPLVCLSRPPLLAVRITLPHSVLPVALPPCSARGSPPR
jgi:hypothetical protein